MGNPISDAWDSFTGKSQVESTNSANAAMAQKQMDFQERMSNTGYQRTVKDMASAGLNPMLAYSQGPASTPAGATATMQTKPSGIESLMKVVNTASMVGAVGKMLADTRLVGQQERGASAEADMKELDVFERKFRMGVQDELVDEHGNKKLGEAKWMRVEREKLETEMVKAMQERSQVTSAAEKARVDARIAALEEKLKKLSFPEAEATAKLFEEGGAAVKSIERLGGYAVSGAKAVGGVGRKIYNSVKPWK